MQKLNTLLGILEKRYGQREPYRSHPPVEQALVTILLKDGKEAPAERTIKRIQREFVDWNEARVSNPDFLDEILGPSYPNGIGKLITQALTAIFNHSQSMNLDDIMAMDPEKAGAKLMHLDPMPSRVGGELLLAGFSYKKVPECSGLLRVARRTRLVRPGPADLQVKALRRLVPASRIPRVVHAFEMLAERICVEQDYDCRLCPLNGHCPAGIDALRRFKVQEGKERIAREAEAKKQHLKAERDSKAHARRTATQHLKRAIQDRSQRLKLKGRKPRKHRKTVPAVTAGARMVQASSAEVRSQRKTARRKKARPRRRTRTA